MKKIVLVFGCLLITTKAMSVEISQTRTIVVRNVFIWSSPFMGANQGKRKADLQAQISCLQAQVDVELGGKFRGSAGDSMIYFQSQMKMR